MSDSANTWWTPARARAFELVVADRITDEDSAREVGICRKTLFNWRQHRLFQARMEEEVAAFARRSLEDAVRIATERFR